jgi:hypothetical protein
MSTQTKGDLDVDDGAMTDEKKWLIQSIVEIELKLEKLRSWSVTEQMVRLRDLQERLAELEAWEAEPNLSDYVN